MSTSENKSESFLLEIGTEELPAQIIDSLNGQIVDLFKNWADKARLSYDSAQSFSTPRRLALLVSGLAVKQSDWSEEIIGPPVSVAFDADGNPTKAADSFAAKNGMSVKDLVVRTGNRGEVIAAEIHHAGRTAMDLLSEDLPAFIAGIKFPKTMRWESTGFRFSRPVRMLVALFGNEIINLEVAGIKSGRATAGHQLLDSGAIEIKRPEDYLEVLLEHKVIADPVERKKTIVEALDALSTEKQHIVPDADLISIINNMVEYPVCVVGEFEENYLDLPQEVLITVLRYHQKIFAVENDEGKLVNHFVVVLNTIPKDVKLVLKGYSRVVRARLEDAYYFYREDLKRSLEDRVADLSKMLHLKGVGSLFDRTQRLIRLVENLTSRINPDLVEQVKRAALLSKADLTTSMIFEFPELQGIMGYYYALQSGEELVVAEALKDYYKPRFAEDSIPASDVSAILALADKADLIASCYAAGLYSSGSQDPYGLRRASIGIIRVLEEREYDLSFRELLNEAFNVLSESGVAFSEKEQKAALDFVEMRAKFYYSDRFPSDIVDAVLATGQATPHKISALLKALNTARNEGWFDEAAAAFKRIQNISKKSDFDDYDASYLVEPAEKQLEEAYRQSRSVVTDSLENQNYIDAISTLVTLKPHVDLFFDNVMVMTEDVNLKQNRLGLLRSIAASFFQIADFTLIREDKG